MSLHTEFDKGSLIWVKSEIEETFGRARESLQSYAAGGEEASLKHAQTYLHQACGALTLVDLAGLARFCEEIELALAFLTRDGSAKDRIPVLLHGIDAAQAYLDRLMAGMSNVPLLLHPTFVEITTLRNGNQSGAELFFPQLHLDLPAGLPTKSLPADEFMPFIRKQRSRFESGLLRWLQGQPNAGQAMAAGLVDVATYQQVGVVRVFWWTAAALALGLGSNRAAVDLDSRQLFLRLNLQMRRLADGSGKVAERLFRDMLYMLAKLDCDSNLVNRLKKSFELASLIPTAEAMALGVERGDLQLARALREDLRVVKDAWSRIAGGQHDRMGQFPNQLAAMAKKAEPLIAPALGRLWTGLADALTRYGSGSLSEADALEFATGLLLADNALAVYPDISPDYAAQVDALLTRLTNPNSAVELPELDSVSREAQERLLMAQIAQEIRVNLQAIEEILDGYFRDPDSVATLSGLVGPLRQVQGALLMLDRPLAVQILQECQKRVDGFMSGAVPEQNELEDLAEALSMLGFYIDDLEQGRAKDDSLQPVLVKLCGFVEHVEEPAIEEALEAEPELADPSRTTAASEPEPAPEPVQESKPLPVSDAAIDAELLEVYLEEAVEVLAVIAEQIEVCRADSYDKEAATLIRRAFHTLKGSGRMVGLNNLGEVAWAIEQVFNKLLQVEKPVSPALTNLVQEAHSAFSGWVAELQKKGTVAVEASGLIARAGIMRDGLESESDSDEPAEPEPESELETASLEVPTEDLSVDVELPALEEDLDEIVIGDVAVSATLFAIFQEEAEHHLAALRHGVEKLAEQGELEPGFILAAHTLGGIVSTTGFRRQGELAYALEHALQQLGADAEREVGLLSEAVTTMEMMLTGICQRMIPGEAGDLVRKLEALRIDAPELMLDEEDAGQLVELSEQDLPETEFVAAPAADSLAKDIEEMLSLMGMEAAPAVLSQEDEPLLPDGNVPMLELDDLAPAVDVTFELPESELAGEVLPEPIEDESANEALVLDEDELTFDLLDESPELAQEPVAQHDISAEIVTEIPRIPEIEEVVNLAQESVSETEIPELEALAIELETITVAAELSEEQGSVAVRKAELDSSLVDDIDEQLLPVFIEEADELLPVVSTQLRLLADGGDADEPLANLKRTLHTLKGSARMSGAMRIGEAAHQMETRLETVTHPSEVLLTQLDNDYDLLQILLDEISGRSVPVAAATAETATTAGVVQAQMPRAIALAEPEGKATIRVKSDLVDELVNQAGEVSIARSRIEAEMLAFKTSLSDLTENVSRLRSQLREIEIQAESQMQARERELQEHEEHFDPLEFDRFTRLQELTRFLAESVNDVGNVQQTLLKNMDESNAALTAQARMTRDLQQSLMRVRLVPFNSVSERLYRLARTTGKEVGKKVNLEIRGGSVEIDRGVLEKMAGPFEHMLRNAIDHGLEDSTARLAAGKNEFGEIQIEARQEGNELVLVLKDDGRGLDLQRIRAKAIEKGIISAAQELSEHDLSMLIFEAGFSTASNVTQLSGRGIGMDVVKNEIGNLGGRIDLTSKLGEGTTFTIRLPLTLAVTQVLLVRAGERVIAIPAALVEQVQELKFESLTELYAKREQEWMGRRYPFAYLPRLIGDLYHQPEQKRYSMVLLLRSGSDRIALHIDSLVKNLEVVVKPVGPQLARAPGVVGATVLGTGEIVLIMNPLFLLPLIDQIAALVDPAQQTLAAAAQERVEELQTAPVVMVVDDSLTVRKITGRLLSREGFQVVTAKDGVDALQQLQDVRPAVMLVDIEMPRMDGFELTRNVRAAPDTRGIPIIMITSRTADKHRNVAFDLGVNVFLGKPFQEEELLGHIRKFIDQ